MKIICTLFCWCILFVSSYARDTAIGLDGAIGKDKEDFPFCPADKNTLRQIKEITAILKGNTTRKKLDCKRARRSSSSCDVSLMSFSICKFKAGGGLHLPLQETN